MDYPEMIIANNANTCVGSSSKVSFFFAMCVVLCLHASTSACIFEQGYSESSGPRCFLCSIRR